MCFDDSEKLLAAYFRELSQERRSQEIYLIEHPLDPDEIEKLRKTVFQNFLRHPLSDSFWSDHALSLCVLITEVGYRYRGTGTDFWPVVARELGIAATVHERFALTRLFEKMALRYRIRRPGVTAWEKHFPLIAWPVGNAVAPREIHAALARTLRQAIRQGVRPSDPDDFLSRLNNIADGLSSVRFSAWLQNADIALEVSTRLLELPVENPFLPQALIDRISCDLAMDHTASRSLTDARTMLALRGRRTQKIEVPRCRLLLHPEGDEGERVLIRGPLVSASLQQQILRVLDLPGDRLLLRGASRSVPLADFISGAIFSLPDLSSLEEPLLGKALENAEGNNIASQVIADMQPAGSGIFERRKNEARYVEVPRGAHMNVESDYCLCPRGEDFQDETKWRFLSPELPDEFKLLARYLSDPVEKAAGPFCFGLPAIEGEKIFMAGFPIIGKIDFLPDRFIPENRGEKAVIPSRHEASKIWFAELGEGRWATPEGLQVDVVAPQGSEVASIDLDPVSPSIDDLLAGNISVKIASPLPLESMSLELQAVSKSGDAVAVTERIERIPLRLTGYSPVFRKLREKFLHDETFGASDEVELTISVPELAQKVIKLRRKAIMFSLGTDGRFRTSEDIMGTAKEYETIEATVQSPVLGNPDTLEDTDVTRLILPAAELRGALSSGVLTGSPLRGQLSASFAKNPLPWVRESANHEERFGLREIARSLIGWRLARADNVIGELHRRPAIQHLEMTSVAQLCGPVWCNLEKRVDVSVLSPMNSFLRLAYRRGLTTGSQCPVLPDLRDQKMLDDILRAKFAETLKSPDQELAYWTAERGADLDLVVSYAYDALSDQMKDAGRPSFDEVDVSYPHTRWRDTLRDAANAGKLAFFRRLVLPDSRWQALFETDFNDHSVDDSIDLLDRIHVDVSRQSGQRNIGREELRALLLFWLAPAKLEELAGWDAPLMRCLSDIFTSRAVRYAALRHRISEHDLPESGALE